MGRLIRFAKAIRNNWKKSTFAALAFSYGVNVAKNSYDTAQMMREYCEYAAKFGDMPQPMTQPLRHVTVILNPAADRRKAKEQFDKYCAPLLHLAGLAVTVVQTEHGGQGRDLPDSLSPDTSAIVIAGGDGTVSETVTGLFRRAGSNLAALGTLPVGVLPLGRTNSVSSALLGGKEKVQALADATLAVIEGTTTPVDVIKVEPIQDGSDTKPIYSVAQVEWGCYRDAAAKKDKYWYVGGLRNYAAVLGVSPRQAEWRCRYTEPCEGCSVCRQKAVVARRWWHWWTKPQQEVDYSKVLNDKCGEVYERELRSVELAVASQTVSGGVAGAAGAHLTLAVGPRDLSWWGFVAAGWRRLRGERPQPEELIPVRDVILTPPQQEEDQWLSIDSEDFEVRPMKITVLPKSLNLFTPRTDCFAPTLPK